MEIRNFFKQAIVFFTLSSFIILASCGNNMDEKNSTDSSGPITNNSETSSKEADGLKPANPKPDWGKDMTDPMAVVIEKLKSFNAPPLISLSAQEARKQPSPADAAMAVMQEHNIQMPTNN